MNNLNPVFERSHSVPGVDTYVGVPSRISLAMLLGPPPLSIDHFFDLGKQQLEESSKNILEENPENLEICKKTFLGLAEETEIAMARLFAFEIWQSFFLLYRAENGELPKARQIRENLKQYPQQLINTLILFVRYWVQFKGDKLDSDSTEVLSYCISHSSLVRSKNDETIEDFIDVLNFKETLSKVQSLALEFQFARCYFEMKNTLKAKPTI